MPQILKTEIASTPDREDLVAEIWIDQHLLAELRQEAGQVRIQIYARPDGRPWDVSHPDLLTALSGAEKRLMGSSR